MPSCDQRRLPPFHAIPLARNRTFTAHLRTADFAVLYAASDDPRSSARLFDEHRETVAGRQPPNLAPPGKRTFTVYLVLTDRCNLRCSYCDVLEEAGQRRAGQRMTWTTAERALEILFSRLTRDRRLHAQVVFFGGEPLLAWPLLARICEQLARRDVDHRVAKMLVTNGTLIDRARAEFLADHRVYVVVSLDGRPAVNDPVRRTADRRGSYGEVARGLEQLIAVAPGKFGISCTAGSHNAASLADEVVFLQRQFDPCCIGINIYHYQRDGAVPIDMDGDALGAALLDAFRRARREGIAIYQFIGILKAFVRRQRNLDYCPACVDKLLFSPQGRVGRCETLMYDERFTVPLDEVVDATLPPHLDWSAYTPEREPACGGCWAWWICPGSCAYDQLVTTGSLAGVDPRRCRFHKALLLEMLDLLLETQLAAAPPPTALIPHQHHFDRVRGRMPLTFPPDTIWIVSLASVVDDQQPQQR